MSQNAEPMSRLVKADHRQQKLLCSIAALMAFGGFQFCRTMNGDVMYQNSVTSFQRLAGVVERVTSCFCHICQFMKFITIKDSDFVGSPFKHLKDLCLTIHSF
jgi:hypothetical protein